MIHSKVYGRAPMAGFGTRLRRYSAVLLALFLREADTRRHQPWQAFRGLLEPLALITLMTGGRYLLDRLRAPPIGDSALLFLATGIYGKYALTFLSRSIPIRPPHGRFPVERRLDFIIVIFTMRLIDYVLMGLVLFWFIYTFVTLQALPTDVLPLFLGLGAAVCLAFGWAIVNLVISQVFYFWYFISGTFNRILLVFSGVFFLPEFMSPQARYLLSFNPLVHAIILVRQGFYPSYPHLVLDTHYLMYWVAGAVAVGFMLERLSRRLERI